VPGFDRPVYGVRAGVRSPVWLFYALAEGSDEELYARGRFFYYDARVLRLVADLLDESVIGWGSLTSVLFPGLLDAGEAPPADPAVVAELPGRIGEADEVALRSCGCVEDGRPVVRLSGGREIGPTRPVGPVDVPGGANNPDLSASEARGAGNDDLEGGPHVG